jgi:serine phosphatase RsbU (regulator of sigma subunit)
MTGKYGGEDPGAAAPDFADVEQDRFEHRPFLLTFRDRPLEEAFNESGLHQKVVRTRVAIILGLLLNILFVYFDVHLPDDGTRRALLVRFGFIVPFLLLGMGLSFFGFFKRRIQELGIAVLLCHAVGNGWMSVVAPMPEGFLILAMIVITVFAHTFAVLSFPRAIATGLAIFAVFGVTAAVFLRHPGNLMIMNGTYLFSINLLGLIATWTIEHHARRAFVQNIVIGDEKRALLRRNQNIESELELARKIQRALIPQHSPHPSIAFFYKPMDKLGGDFIDLIPLADDGRTGVFISDVSGHGVPAAFITAMVKSVLNQAGNLRLDPAALLGHLNQALLGQTNGNFVTALYGVFDPGAGTFVYAGAGHPAPFVVGTERIERLDRVRQGMPLAMRSSRWMEAEGKGFRNSSLALDAGEKLLLFTDGLTEVVHERSRDRDGLPRDFEQEALPAALEEFRRLPSGLFVQELSNRLVAYRGGDSFDDDICMICLESGSGGGR